jgi:hypothetical protein
MCTTRRMTCLSCRIIDHCIENWFCSCFFANLRTELSDVSRFPGQSRMAIPRFIGIIMNSNHSLKSECRKCTEVRRVDDAATKKCSLLRSRSLLLSFCKIGKQALQVERNAHKTKAKIIILIQGKGMTNTFLLLSPLQVHAWVSHEFHKSF